MASDIKKIVDTVAARPESVEKFARLVSKEEIRSNGYSLNIPRYVNSSDNPETWDVYATMFGGIPNHEIDLLEQYWNAFPQLRSILFTADETPYSALAVENIKETIEGSENVKAFIAAHQAAFADFETYLDGELIAKMTELNVSQTEDVITQNIFDRVAALPLIDKYQAYQLLDDKWGAIATDLEIIQTEGFEATKQVDPNMVIKKKGDKEEEVQNGWVGHVIPFELVQTTLLRADYDALKSKEARLNEISAEITEIIDSIDEADRGDFLNDDNTAFVAKEFAVKMTEIYADISTPELTELQGYLNLLATSAGKAVKLQYIADHHAVNWTGIEGNTPYAKGKVVAYMKQLQAAYTFPENSFEAKMVEADKLMTEEKTVKKEAKEMADALHLKTKTTIEGLTDEQVLALLRLKWIAPLCASLRAMPDYIAKSFVDKVIILTNKYSIPYATLGKQILEVKKQICAMIDDLTGDDYAMQGLQELKEQLQVSQNIGKLQNLKKAMLQKMFPESGAEAPQIRFNKFSEPWKRHKLSHYLETSAQKNTQNLYTKEDVLSVSGEFGVVNQIKHLGRSYSGSVVSNYGVVNSGDVIYTKSPLKEAPYGIIKTNTDNVGIVSALYAVYHPKGNVFSPFVQTYFDLDHRLNDYLRPLISKGAKNTINVGDEAALDGEVLFPDYEEQFEIYKFFSNFDKLILLNM